MLGRPTMQVSGHDFKLGEPPLTLEFPTGAAHDEAARAARAVDDEVDPLLDALRDLTAAVRTLTLILQTPPWYVRLGRWLRSFWRS